MTATKERTLAIIKPGAFKSRQAGPILSEIQAKGFTIVDMRLVRFTADQARAFYAAHAGRPYFEGLVEHQTSGPSVALVLEGPVNGAGAIQKWRDLMGPTDPSLGTATVHLRAKYGYGMPGNAVHGSDSPEEFQRESDIVFNWAVTQTGPSLTAVKELVKTLEAAPPEALAKQLVQEASVVPPAPGSSETAGG